MFVFNTLAVAVSLVAFAAAGHSHNVNLHARSHHIDRSKHRLQKRFNGRATYFAVGLGACGITNVPSDPIVALNTAQFGDGYPGPNCFKSITICKAGTNNCQNAQITDACPTCNYGDLDLSEGLFTRFASTDAGIFQMTWTFNDGNSGGSQPTTTSEKPAPTTTAQPEPKTTWKPEPTTTWEPPTTTSTEPTTTTSSPKTTSTPDPTTTSSSTSSSTSSTPTTTSTTTSTAKSTTSTSSSIPIRTSATAASATPSATTSTGSGDGSTSSSSGSNLVDMNQAFIALGELVIAAHDE